MSRLGLRADNRIMRRTQVYLEEDVWAVLRNRAQQTGLSISALIREAVRDRYFRDQKRRQEAMLGFVGMRKDRDDIGETEEYVRRLRRGTRLKRITRKEP